MSWAVDVVRVVDAEVVTCPLEFAAHSLVCGGCARSAPGDARIAMRIGGVRRCGRGFGLVGGGRIRGDARGALLTS